MVINNVTQQLASTLQYASLASLERNIDSNSYIFRYSILDTVILGFSSFTLFKSKYRS